MTESLSPDFSTVAGGWAKWDEWVEQSYTAFNQILMERAGIQAGSRVLDLGSGSGFPSLREAEIVGEAGSVTGMDVSTEMIQLATQRIVERGLKNVQYVQGDMVSLQFPDRVFDAITARFSLMFVSSIERTLAECFRVLRPHGKLAVTVWAGPEKNMLPRQVVELYFTLPAPSLTSPGPYRFSEPGALKNLMEDAGFVDVIEEEFAVYERFADGNQFVDHVLEASALWGGYLRKLESDRFEEAKRKLSEAAERYREGNEIRILRTAIMISAGKPDE